MEILGVLTMAHMYIPKSSSGSPCFEDQKNPSHLKSTRKMGLIVLEFAEFRDQKEYSDALAVRIFSKNTLGKFLQFFHFFNPNLGKSEISQLEYFYPRRGPCS